MGTARVPGNIWAPKWSPGKYWHSDCSLAHVGTRMVPRHIMAREGAQTNNEQRKSTQAYKGTGRENGHMWSKEWCRGTYQHGKGARTHNGQRKGARAHKGTRRVHGHILASVRCPVTYEHWKGTQANMGTGKMPGLI